MSCKNHKIFSVTGHSLGGALATHATAQLLVAGINVEQFYTYGSPRVGDSKFTSWFDNLLSQKTNNKARVTHGRDPVPHLPPSEWGFLHVPH
jgi:predicted lipase